MSAAVLLAGCGSSASSSSAFSSQDRSSFTATTAQPSGPVNVVRWNAQTGEPSSLDWIYTYDTGSGNSILSNVCEGLMRQTPQGTIQSALAASVATPNATTFVYRLRPGVRFSDGKPMTAKDVAFSLNRNLSAKPASFWQFWYRNVKSVVVTGPEEVTVHLTKPDVLFGEMMSTPAGYVGEEAYIKAQGTKYGTPNGGVMCTGPYELSNWSHGNSITITRNPYYWDTQLKPHAPRFVFTFLTNDASLTDALVTGSIDGTWTAPLSGLSRLRSSGAGTLYLNKSSFVFLIEITSVSGALHDVRIRQALKYLIDYNGIVSGLLQGAGTAETSATPSPVWGYDRSVYATAHAALIPAQQDIAKARQLITAAGAPKQPIVIAADASANPVGLQSLLALKSTAQQVGLNINVRAVPTSSYSNLFFDPKARSGIDAITTSTTADIPDPLELYIQLLPESPYDYAHIVNRPADNAFRRADTISDPGQRAALVVAGQRGYIDNVEVLPVYSPDVALFMSKRITGAPVSSLASIYYPWAATIGAR